MDVLILNAQRLVHIDLKGAPPKLTYFERFFPFVRNLGATGILLEWEDTFPYTKSLQQIGGLSHSAQATNTPYNLAEAHQLLDLAINAGLTIIPLVQTFGHMEFVLKHEQWKGLREVECYPSSMCASNSETLILVKAMVKQIVDFHQQNMNIEYIHIGADEVWHLGLCPTCVKRVNTSNDGKAGLYLDYLSQVVQFIKGTYPNLKIIMWDDMLRGIDEKIIQSYNLGCYVEPMVWHYSNSNETFNLGISSLWDKYANCFPNMWVASAFKGATSSCQIIPIQKFHVSNHEAWLAELSRNGNKLLHFKGLALTGWSRYDHYATLCELLPTAIPSLALCIKTWLCGGYSQEMHDSVGKLLGYCRNDVVSLINSDDGRLFIKYANFSPQCQLAFPGWQIYIGFEWFCILRTKYRTVIESDQMQTWLNQWQIMNNYTNPMQIETILPVITDLLNELSSLEEYLKVHLEEIFFGFTIEELIGTLVIPIKQHLKQIKSDCETQLTCGCRIRGHRRLNF